MSEDVTVSDDRSAASPDADRTATGWWTRNRWAALSLPFALVAALVASSDRVADYFWSTDLRQPQTAERGEWLDFRSTYHDALGEHPLDVRLRLESIRPVTTGWDGSEPLDLPEGSVALAVTIKVEADPDLPLAGCMLALRGEDGARYDYLPGYADAFQPSFPCVPPDAPGPFPSLGELGESLTDDGAVRPGSWTVEPVVVVPSGTEIAEVLLWWEKPAYASLAAG